MIIECKKSSYALLVVIFLTSLNCLAMDEERAVGAGHDSDDGYQIQVESEGPKQGILKSGPSASNFYAGSWKQYGCRAGAGLAAVKAGYELRRSSWDNSISKNHPMIYTTLSAGLISYNQYRVRSEQAIANRGYKTDYFKPFAGCVALGGLAGLTHFALSSAGYIDASSYGESCLKSSLAEKIAKSVANGAIQAAFWGSPLVVTGAVFATIEGSDDAKKHAQAIEGEILKDIKL